MKSLTLATAILLSLLVSSADAQPEILWSRTFGSSAEAEVCNDIIAISDSVFVLAGNSRQTSHHTCMLTMFVNDEGGVLSRYIQGTSDHLLANALCVHSNELLTLAGSRTLTQANPHRDGFVANVSGSDSISGICFGSTGVDQFNAMTLDTSGTVILAGHTSSFGAGESDFWLVSANLPMPGALNRTFGGEDEDECYDILLTDDMGYLLAGMTKSFGPGTRNMFIIRTNALGDSLWSRVIGSRGSQECNAVVQTADGGFALAGHDNYEFSLIRTDHNGNEIWSRIYEGYECNDLVQTRDGGFLLAGDIWTGGDAEWDGRVVRTDSQGRELWSLTIDRDIDDHFYAADLSPDGSFILGGYTNAPNGPDEVWLARLGIEPPMITVNHSDSQPVLHWITPYPGDYTIYSTTDPNHNVTSSPGLHWTWESTLHNLPVGAASWTDPGSLQSHKYYVVVRSTL